MVDELAEDAGNGLLLQLPADAGAGASEPMARGEVLSPDATKQLLHDLHVHQIELEMQNEQLRRTQTELDQTRTRYFDLYHLAPVGYCTVSESEQILEANLTASALLGVPCSKLVGTRVQKLIVPADQDIYYLHRKKLFGTGQPHTCELRMLRDDGSQFWAELTATHAQDASGQVTHRLVLTDIHARKLAQDRIRISDVALKVISQGVLMTTPDLCVISANAAFLAMTGYTEQELVGSNCMRFSGALTDKATKQALLQAIKGKRKFSCEMLNYRKNGSSFWNEMSITPIVNDSGKLTHLIGIHTDITERKRSDQALAEKNHELQAATATAEKANQAKSEFLSSMSHELRSPLNAILGFAQLLESGAPTLTALQQSNIDKILQGGWYLLTLIDEILDLALIESGKLAVSLDAVPLSPLLCDCQSMVESQADKKGIRVSFPQIPGDRMVHADAIRLKQVIVNLLSNAIKYNRPGGTVEVCVDTGAQHTVRISVRDTGVGLSPEQLAQMFQSFNRLGQECSTTEGTGVGLVVAKRLTELMAGKIGVESTVGTGSVFWVELGDAQALQATANAMHSVDKNRSTPALPFQPPCTVLYVEDNPVNLDLVAQILASRSNVRLLSARDGAQGLEMARAQRPEVILMDINLPGISGLEVLRLLRIDPETRHIPVLAVSANAMPQEVVKGLEAGFYCYLTKPFRIHDFLETLDLALAFSLTRSAQEK